MYYTYILLSKKDKKFYIGYTQNLRKRYRKHQKGDVRSTKPRLPMILVFYEAYINKYDALRRERYLKTTKGRTTIRSMLKEYLKLVKIV